MTNFGFFMACFVILAFVCFKASDLIDRYRRKKYPEYFKYYDAAVEICFVTGQRIEQEAELIQFKFKMLADGLQAGECTEEYFKKQFDYWSDRYVKATQEFKERHAEAEKLFREADLYAKRNNLMWGVIY